MPRAARSRWSRPVNAGPTARCARRSRTTWAPARSSRRWRGDAVASPEARYAARAYRASGDTLADDIRASVSGRELIESGYAGDVESALEIDASRNVPVLSPDGFFSAAA